MAISPRKRFFAVATAFLRRRPWCPSRGECPGTAGAGGWPTETMISSSAGRAHRWRRRSGASAILRRAATVLAQLQGAGATVLSTTSLVDTITASVSPAEAQVPCRRSRA